MRKSRNSASWPYILWPGLPAAWLGGRIGGLLVAVGFTLVLELALLTNFVWPLWFGTATRTVVWLCVALYWLVGTVPAWLRGATRFPDEPSRLGLFRQAQVEYLSGNWFAAERLLKQLLGADATDADVRLMLATLYRRVRRWDAAQSELALVATYDQFGKWQLEVSRERILLQQERAWQNETRHNETRHNDVLVQQNKMSRPNGRASGAA